MEIPKKPTHRYQPVNSSWIDGLKRTREATIRMRTNDGSVYDYYGSKRKFKKWLEAGNSPGRGPDETSSAGKYFHVHELGDDLIKRVAKKKRYGK